MKPCTICKCDKDESEFNKKHTTPDGLQRHCRDCSKERYKARYNGNPEAERRRIHERRQTLADQFADYKKSLSCCFCGEDTTCCLDFHHNGNKDMEVSNMARQGYSWKRVMEEIEKCIVVCANCHRKLHAGLL